MNKDILFLRLSTYKEIKHAFLNYHYSKAIPAGKYYSLSVFENKIFKCFFISYIKSGESSFAFLSAKGMILLLFNISSFLELFPFK